MDEGLMLRRFFYLQSAFRSVRTPGALRQQTRPCEEPDHNMLLPLKVSIASRGSAYKSAQSEKKRYVGTSLMPPVYSPIGRLHAER